ncbi:MAG: NADH:flavin oxidoreductase [Proteobacteria bacterium]|nr:NADH:flavin oxidoreductase [Pseudomonadota bacterium]
MPKLFETTTLKNMTLPNRFVRSATWEGRANQDGSCTHGLINMMTQLARGGVGLIITGHAYVRKDGQAGPWQLGVYSDQLIQGLTEMTEAVHKENGKIVMQLAHAGCQAPFGLTGLEPLGPWGMENQEGSSCRKMSQADISKVIEVFARGAVRAKQAGFDGVQIHAAHGYLLSQFLSSFFNKRTDEYGGTVENRTRVVLEVIESIRASVGHDFPVLIKINSEDFLDKGLAVDDMLHVAALLEQAGIDAIELSGGTAYSGRRIPVRIAKIDTEEKEVFYKAAAKRYKERITVPLMLVGGIRSYEVAERLVDKGIADYISLCRPLIREPNLINRWKQGDNSKATCLSDNLCFKPTRAGQGLYCVTEERLRNK